MGNPSASLPPAGLEATVPPTRTSCPITLKKSRVLSAITQDTPDNKGHPLPHEQLHWQKECSQSHPHPIPCIKGESIKDENAGTRSQCLLCSEHTPSYAEPNTTFLSRMCIPETSWSDLILSGEGLPILPPQSCRVLGASGLIPGNRAKAPIRACEYESRSRKYLIRSSPSTRPGWNAAVTRQYHVQLFIK